MHIIAAKAVALGEALTPEFKEYQKQVVKNAAALCDGLIGEGFDIVSGSTDNHLILLNLINSGITGKELEHRLDEVHITANKNTVPNDPQSPFVTSGVRLGTPAVTTRGFKAYHLMYIHAVNIRLATVISVLIVFAVRILATVFKLDLPKVKLT